MHQSALSIIIELILFLTGCVLIKYSRIDQERMGIIMIATIAALVLAMMIILTPDYLNYTSGLGLAEAYWIKDPVFRYNFW